LLRKTDSGNPADWLYLAASDLEGIRDLATRELAYHLCRSQLAEVIEQVPNLVLAQAERRLLAVENFVVLEQQCVGDVQRETGIVQSFEASRISDKDFLARVCSSPRDAGVGRGSGCGSAALGPLVSIRD
jgi:hypothetical protein